MKYTPEELYQYAKENDLLLGLEAALNCNQKRFRSVPAEIRLSLADGTYYIEILNEENLKGQLFEAGKEGDAEVDRIYEAFRKDPESVFASIVLREDDDSTIVFVTGEGEETAKETLVRKIALLFLEHAEIDTHGKLRVACENALKEIDKIGEMLFGY